jgi:hypothetical protein
MAISLHNERTAHEDATEYGDVAKEYQQSTFSAHFVEVCVAAATGETRVPRMLAVYAAGAFSSLKPVDRAVDVRCVLARFVRFPFLD